jgi:hypothetical protein
MQNKKILIQILRHKLIYNRRNNSNNSNSNKTNNKMFQNKSNLKTFLDDQFKILIKIIKINNYYNHNQISLTINKLLIINQKKLSKNN